ncbi:uncharacterized protein LOC125464825 isoform X2 [Stegostoma tigrinum]|uniref:uncharacterized protein LOC125464825 isoform X2 n=1 Tax=Stegostoma tigrinum TaxID=3053191 RepID=UPI00202B58DB|nr:uncharacterized protein LOC125464825 isoform X2 [Stegostoma tigrinum]
MDSVTRHKVTSSLQQAGGMRSLKNQRVTTLTLQPPNMSKLINVEPRVAGAFKERQIKPTAFRKFYKRGDFPVAMEHDAKGNRIAWKQVSRCSTPSWTLLLHFGQPWASECQVCVRTPHFDRGGLEGIPAQPFLSTWGLPAVSELEGEHRLGILRSAMPSPSKPINARVVSASMLEVRAWLRILALCFPSQKICGILHGQH